jgi:hypothetical protein
VVFLFIYFCKTERKFHVLSRLRGFGYSMTLGLGLPTLRKRGKAIKEAEGLCLGLLSSRDGFGISQLDKGSVF